MLAKGRRINENPLSDVSVGIARSWLQDCVENHRWCGRKRGKHLLPTRVIDVGSPDQLVRLVHGEGQAGQWIALSHTWGGVVSFTTTKGTLAAHAEEIAMGELPATFRDAVLITRALGVRYLWIDSVCIIQDDPDDWRREAACMAHVFKNALLAISATTAANSHDGILRLRREAGREVRLRASCDAVDFDGTMVIRPWLHPWTESVDSARSPLSNRGWVLQERILASRTLHYGEQQMFWECRTKVWSEGLLTQPDASDLDGGGSGWEWERNKLFLLPPAGAQELDAPYDERGKIDASVGSENWRINNIVSYVLLCRHPYHRAGGQVSPRSAN